MKLIDNIVRIFTGRLNKYTQHASWSGGAVNFTSNFIMNIQYRIANELSKTYFNHVQYTTNDTGFDYMKNMTGSDIDEVLNWSPKGYENTTEFWREVTLQLLQSKSIHLKPTFSDTTLTDLRNVNDGEEFKLNETVNIISPFFSNENTSLLDNVLTSVYDKLAANKTKAFLKVNTTFDVGKNEFKAKVLEQLATMQEVGEFNGIGVLDAKTDLIELNNSYSVLSAEELGFIKTEILSGYGISESVLTGTATQEETNTFYANAMVPLLNQLERELTYKLISSYKRVRREGKQSYQKIVINNAVMKFATLDQLIKFSQMNTNTPIAQQNEERSFYGLPPVEGGDQFFVNLNATTSKQIENNQSEVSIEENNQ